MSDAYTVKIVMKTMVFTTPIRLNCTDLRTKKTFNMLLKLQENFLNIGFVFEKIDPREFAVVINKINIKFESTGRWVSRPPNVSVNKL